MVDAKFEELIVAFAGVPGFYSASLNTITKLTIKGVCTEIGNEAYSDFLKLKNVIIEEGVESLGNSVFGNTLEEIYLPNSLIEIGSTPIAEGGSVQITYNGTMTEFNAIQGKENILSYYSVICSDGTIAKTA